MRAAWAVLAACAVLVACGDDSEDSEPRAPTVADGPAAELTIRADDGTGDTARGGLTCRGTDAEVTGDLAGGRAAAQLCREARSLKTFLTQKPEGRRICTKIYGGPETARVTGTIDGREVDRRFTRTDGCEINDYARVARILPR